MKVCNCTPCLGYHFGGINGRLTVNSIQLSHFNYLKVLLSFWVDTKPWYCCENHVSLHLPQPHAASLRPRWFCFLSPPAGLPSNLKCDSYLFVFTKPAPVSTSTNGCSGKMHRKIRERWTSRSGLQNEGVKWGPAERALSAPVPSHC